MNSCVYIIQDIEGTIAVFRSLESLRRTLSKLDENHEVFSHHSEVQRWILDTAESEFVCKTKDINNYDPIPSGWFKGEKYL